MDGACARIVEAGRDGVWLDDLSVFCLHEFDAAAVEDAHCALLQAGRCLGCVYAVASCFAEDELDAFIIEVVVDGACCVGSASDACYKIVGVVTSCLFQQLPFDFF